MKKASSERDENSHRDLSDTTENWLRCWVVFVVIVSRRAKVYGKKEKFWNLRFEIEISHRTEGTRARKKLSHSRGVGGAAWRGWWKWDIFCVSIFKVKRERQRKEEKRTSIFAPSPCSVKALDSPSSENFFFCACLLFSIAMWEIFHSSWTPPITTICEWEWVCVKSDGCGGEGWFADFDGMLFSFTVWS